MIKIFQAGILTLLFLLPPNVVAAGAKEDIQRARELFDKGDFEGSVTFSSYAIDSGELSGTTLAEAYYHRGLSYSRLIKSDNALSDFELAITFDPTLVPAWSSICFQKAIEKKQFDDGLVACNEALRLDPRHGPTYAIRGDIWSLKGNFDAALRDFTQAGNLAPDNWMILYNRGRLYDTMGESEKARSDLAKAYGMAPAWGRVHPSARDLFKKYGLNN